MMGVRGYILKKPFKNPLINNSAKKKNHETGKKAHAVHINIFKMYPGKKGIQKSMCIKDGFFYISSKSQFTKLSRYLDVLQT